MDARRRAARIRCSDAISIYEVHLGSWQRAADGGFLELSDARDAAAGRTSAISASPTSN